MPSHFVFARDFHSASTTVDSVEITANSAHPLRVLIDVIGGGSAAGTAEMIFLRATVGGSGGTPTTITPRTPDQLQSSPVAALFTAKYGNTTGASGTLTQVGAAKLQALGGIYRMRQEDEIWLPPSGILVVRAASGTPNIGLQFSVDEF